jgi:polysaccharide biosynthesis protein PslH
VKDTRPCLAFVSPLFLFPNDAGGKIRSTNILRGLKGGSFRVRLLSPASPEQQSRWAGDLQGICDEFVPWRPSLQRPKALRAVDLLSQLPVNVAADRSEPAKQVIAQQLARSDIDLMVFDFVHASVLRPARLPVRSVCFTHNVEAEIFERHAVNAKDSLRRWMWRSQHAKMRRFEAAALKQYDTVIAVSERDAQHFKQAYGLNAEAIPTGVDLEHFTWALPQRPADGQAPKVLFVGSMDSAANIDGVRFFIEQAWPQVLAQVPQAQLQIVGRKPPASLVALGKRSTQVSFTGFVDDVRPFIRSAQASVIPLLVGGGTRIKAFELMAMGCPVVSTAVGIEGLGVQPDEHHLERDTAAGMAEAVVTLLRDAAQREALSQRARSLVEQRFGHRIAAQVFERICLQTLA